MRGKKYLDFYDKTFYINKRVWLFCDHAFPDTDFEWAKGDNQTSPIFDNYAAGLESHGRKTNKKSDYLFERYEGEED